MSERNLFVKFLTANIEGRIFQGEVRKAVTVNLFSLVGVASLIYFLVGGIINHKLEYSIVVATFLVLTLGTILMFQKNKNTKTASILIVILMFFLEIALFVDLGVDITGLFWFYLFPMLAFFMLGKNLGVLFSTLLLIITFVLFKFPFAGINEYPDILHERFFITYIATAMLAFIFEHIRDLTFNAFLAADKEKSEYLEETLQQKEEIKAQAELLEQKNVELQQLSVVASETSNSVIITDAKTNIEWVNNGFIRLTNYSLEEFKEKCPTLLKCSQHQEKMLDCLTLKESVSYQSQFELKDGNYIWLQSNITPILDEKRRVIKLVIIETDITEQKLKEQEIREKNEELSQQRDEILAQKDELLAKNEIISEKNEAIRQSIEYALSIQKSILPELDNFNELFENFIIYKPKDIVSGDFYWTASIDGCNFIAVVDCTGHGVPGAFMSILGSRMLDEIVLTKKIYSPAEILENLHKSVFRTLRQGHDQASDGMDLIICKVRKTDELNSHVIFCGAKRPFIYYDSETSSIVSKKGVRKSIGGNYSKYNTEEFADEEMTLSKDSVIYLTSDGYIDQHNSDRFKIGSRNLLKIIYSEADNPLKIQKEKLTNFLKDWQSSEIQTDDITIWGIKV